MIKNAFMYVTRKRLKSLVILLVILSMSALSLISLSIKASTNKAANKTFNGITNSFSMEINRNVNPGTPRGGGNIKGEDIKKIIDTKYIDNYVKRIGSVADLVNLEIIRPKELNGSEDEERLKKFKNTVMLTGVNNSKKEKNFVSGVYKLVKGEHLTDKDKHKVLVHEDLLKKNNLKIGDKIKLKSNIYDADNEKGANETVEVTIKGVFSGQNKGMVTQAQELYANTIISDIHTAAKVYGNTEDTAIYQDVTFYVKGNKNIDSVISKLKSLDIDWNAYNLVKSESNYPILQESISKIYKMADKLFLFSLIFAGVVVSLLLFLWLNARKKEIAVLLSLGISKVDIFIQFLVELVLITIPAYIGGYFLSLTIGNKIGNTVFNSVTGKIVEDVKEKALSSGLGGGAEVDGFNKTFSHIDFYINNKAFIYVVVFMTIVLILSLIIGSFNILKKKPKELLIDTK